MKAPSTQQAPNSAGLSPRPGDDGKAGQASEPKLDTGAGGRGTPGWSPPTLPPSPRNPAAPRPSQWSQCFASKFYFLLACVLFFQAEAQLIFFF